MINAHHRRIFVDGLWRNNSAAVHLLGLSPLLALSNSVVNALGLGLATLVVLSGSSLLASLLRHRINVAIRLPVLLMLVAALTTCVELVMQSQAFKLHQSLGIFVPLIVTNALILNRSENFARHHPPLASAFDGLANGAGFLLLFVILGALREALGTGALLANMDQLLPFASGWKVQLFHADSPFLLAVLPPGAFLALGFLIALKNMIDRRIAQSKLLPEEAVAAGSKRVRVTGRIT